MEGSYSSVEMSWVYSTWPVFILKKHKKKYSRRVILRNDAKTRFEKIKQIEIDNGHNKKKIYLELFGMKKKIIREEIFG